MSYVITIRDSSPYKVDDATGEALRDQWGQAKKPFPVRFGNDSILSTQIVSIAKEKLTEADIPFNEEVKRIEAQGHCRGQYSIQLHINMIAHDESGKDWKKLIADKAWREQTRQHLRSMQPDGWCDYKANECSCESEYLSDRPRHNPDLVV